MMTWDDKDIKAKMEANKYKFLLAAGVLAKNQAVQNAHVVSGTLKNSITYQLKNEGSEFGTGGGTPPSDAKVEPPRDENLVRVGSALIYANAQERHNGFMSKTFDQIQSRLEELAARVMQ